MQKAQWLGLIRHLLTFAGGIAVANGWADEASAQQIVGGIITVGGGLWSVFAPEKSQGR